MAWPAVIADFKAYFTREFTYGSGTDTVTDADITRALIESGLAFNETLWGSDAEKSIPYLYLTAHNLVLNIQAAGGIPPVGMTKGLKSGGGGIVQSKNVGSVSVSYALSQEIINSPILGQYMRTDFGQKYLSLIAPRLVGNVSVIGGQPAVGVFSGE